FKQFSVYCYFQKIMYTNNYDSISNQIMSQIRIIRSNIDSISEENADMEQTDIEKQHFLHLLNKLPDGIFITDIEGFALWANDTSTRQLGVPRSEIIGSHVEDLESKGLFTPSVTRIVMEKKESVSEVQTSLDRQYLATGYLTRIPKSNIDYILVQVKDI